MAESGHMAFLDLNYNSIELSENDQVATLVGSKGEVNLSIVYFNQPLTCGLPIRLDVKKKDTSHAHLCSFIVGHTSCDVETIRNGFYHTFSL